MNRLCPFTIAIACGWALLAIADGLPRQPIPLDEAQAKVRELFIEVHGQDWTAANTLIQKREIATQWLHEATKSVDPVERYVLFDVTLEKATEAGDLELAFEAIDGMASQYEIDAYRLKGQAISRVAKSPSSDLFSHAIFDHALKLIDEAIQRDDLVAAQYLAAIAVKATHEGSIKQQQATARSDEVDEIADAHADVPDALNLLNDLPMDPEANLTVGRYYCFFKGDWDVGLLWLALGSDKKFRELAVKELQGVSGPDEQAILGDAWWDLATASEGVAQTRMQEHCVSWYRIALPGLTGLVKEKVEKRLVEIAGSMPGPDTPPSAPARPATRKCSVCKGKGRIYTKCRNPMCARGTVRVSTPEVLAVNPNTGQPLVRQAWTRVPCPVCGGRYIVKDEPCTACGGRGKVDTNSDTQR